MHARVHDDDAAQDIRNMGGLHKWLPLTHGTFAAATAAIIGLPLTSGFFSKDEILYRAYVNHTVNPMAGSSILRGHGVFEPPQWLGHALYWAAVAAAAMTAFYMCRLYILTFWGTFRGWTVGRPSLLARQELVSDAHTQSSPSSHEAEDDDDAPHPHHEDLSTPGYPPHESPWQMTVPLIILAAFSVFAGFLNPGFIKVEKPMEHWLEPVFKAATEGAVITHEANEWTLALGGIGAFLFGSILAWWVYVEKKGKPAERAKAWAPALYRLVLEKWRVDEFYEATVIAGIDSLAETSAAVDRGIVDGILARLTSLLVAAAGTVLRAFQTGVVQVYAATMVIGLAAVGWFFTVPHASATVSDAGNDDYLVTAAPGVGYAYRWDGDGDGKPDKPDFGAQGSLKVHVLPGTATMVTFEVKNAFGFVRTKRLSVARPQAPVSSL
jgi:NADH-quinone oxidoreductase subunit L